MRPLPGRDTIPGNSGSGDDTTSSFVTVNTASPMSFIFADDAALDGSVSPDFPPAMSPHAGKLRKEPGIRLHSAGSSSGRDNTCAKSTLSSPDSPSPAQDPPTPLTPIDDYSAAMRQATGLSLPTSSGPISAISSQSSRRGSLSYSISEDQQSYTFSAFEGSIADQLSRSPEYDDHVESQLIMPTLAVPTRRPFTDQGKALGRLKLLVAGDTGIGKTSLIKAIVHACEHITHVDPPAMFKPCHEASPSVGVISDEHPTDRTTFSICETFASTKPYPVWWNLVVEDHPSPRRQSTGDSVLDRNICFVDYTGHEVAYERVHAEISNYVDQHLRKSMMSGLDESDVLTTISNGGGVLVDAVIYLIPSSGLSSRDVKLLRQLESKTSIIPVVARADTMSSAEIARSQELILEQLAKETIAPFDFHSSAPAVKDPSTIFAISSISGSDQENMDASILMSSDYKPPLVPTDLVALLEKIFSTEGGSRLRHATAKKLLRWRKIVGGDACAQSSLTYGGIATTPMDGRIIPAFLHRSNNHGQGRWTQVRLVDWASDLQRSLVRERAACDHVLYEQSAAWLRRQMEEQTDTQNALALTSRGSILNVGRKFGRNTRSVDLDVRPQDPLGLIHLGLQMRLMGWFALELAGSASMMGGLALWMLSS